ncbi:carbohydrate ABC transporter substrate-binding protein (CUT1 family) [Tamaricihabitans halophyticus]|uniref:Probable sugar-binding periplasmic protein n=1 Tax=Tamaricihabitans halophyticus TaxID=1262583 RepID=A0A4R2R6T2_9PSEU|nr:ABC transporter substrate-binding protein [Tamaricihabitans halophyticus]TCP55055.1 carbohydrate ABC transporter substrate-binding protein (CUT1 family) [Tamaricihabitans halophyticus]
MTKLFRRNTIRLAASTMAAGFVLAACGGGPTEPATAEPPPNRPVTITVWSNFADRELEALREVMRRFDESQPNISVEVSGNQDDDKITQAIRGGIPPDVAISSASYHVGLYCSSGAWQDLGPYLERDEVDLSRIPQAVRNYTQYQGTRCSMPMLADTFGLYYNKELFAKAGIDRPPRTMSELTDYAKRLTEFNPDGSIKVAGFVPRMFFYQNYPTVWAPQWGADWVDKKGKSSLATDPAWQRMLRWQKELTDYYGWERLQRFTSKLGLYSSADQGFQTGEIAMVFDGEYRTAFLADQAPDVNYGTAPAPVADDRRNTYGGGYITGSTVGIPRGANQPGAAWEAIKYLSTNTEAQLHLANEFGNVPSTLDAAKHPDLEADERFQTFLDIFTSPHLATSPPTPNGLASIKTVESFLQSWQAGQVDDLPAELADLDQAIDDAKELGRR